MHPDPGQGGGVVARLNSSATGAAADGVAVRDIGFGAQVRDRLPGQVAAVLDDPGPADQMAAWLANQTRLATVARGFLYGAAGEAALKIQERHRFSPPPTQPPT